MSEVGHIGWVRSYKEEDLNIRNYFRIIALFTVKANIFFGLVARAMHWYFRAQRRDPVLFTTPLIRKDENKTDGIWQCFDLDNELFFNTPQSSAQILAKTLCCRPIKETLSYFGAGKGRLYSHKSPFKTLFLYIKIPQHFYQIHLLNQYQL